MIKQRNGLLAVFCAAIVALGAHHACATAVQDLVRIKGHERNVLTGLGIVIGLPGTGDSSKDSAIAARPYSQLLANLGNPVASLDELIKADAYAIVQVTMDVPATGAREGDRLDVSVEAMFNAKSLEGGRLVVSMLRPPLPDSPSLRPMAFAEGQLLIEGTNPRSAKIRQGGQMIVDIRAYPVTPGGTMSLVLKDSYAGYPVASMLAAAINDEFGFSTNRDIARVEDAKNILISVPEADRSDPASFIATLMTITVDPSLILTEARIVVNQRQGTIAVTGNVQIGPVGLTHRGLSITTITPEPIATPETPQIETTQWANVDTTDRRSRSSTRLVELLRALDQLRVPVEDQIGIIHELQKTGALHAEIITQ